MRTIPPSFDATNRSENSPVTSHNTDSGSNATLSLGALVENAHPVREYDLAGALRGFVDVIGERCIAGWAQNVAHPEAPVRLDIYAGGKLIGQTLADMYREDLQQAGLGSGHHAFIFARPDRLTWLPDAIEVRRSPDGVLLGVSRSARRTSGAAPPRRAIA